MSRKPNVYFRVRLTVEESRRLTELAQQWGFKKNTDFVRASLGRRGYLNVEIDGLEKRIAATLTAARTEIARLQRTEYVLFAMLENLAKTILTHLPPLAAEHRTSTIALGKAAYERYLKAVGASLHNGSTSAVETLVGLET